jgi:hypothetical protein
LRVGTGLSDEGSDFDDPTAVRRWLAELPARIEREIPAAR